MTYLSIIISQTDLETSQILETLKSLETQTFTDYEIIALNTLKTSPHFKTYDSHIKNKIIYTNTKKISPNIKNAKGEYILFLNENYQFYSENTLQTFTNMLKQETPELLYSNENTQNNTLPLNNLIYNTFYNNNFIKNITSDLSFNTPFLSLYFGTDIITNLNNYKITSEKLTKNFQNNILLSFNNNQEIHDYIKCIKYVLYNLKKCSKQDTIYDFSKNLPEINYENIPPLSKKELQQIKNKLKEITTIISNKNNKTTQYYISKYFRTFYDLLYNNNTNFEVLISVLIPTYNVEEYIDDCLTSLIKQNLKDIEIICVDDISTDTTPDIIKYYQQKDNRIKYYQLKEKQGSGGCRNYALTKARGKYIQYVDSDDFLDLNALKELYEIAEREKIQILMYKATSYNHNENKFFIENYYDMKELSHHLNKLMGIKEYDSDIFRTAVVPWNKLYLKSFLTSLNVKFPEHLIHQDSPFFFETMINADRIYFIEKYYYNHRHREKSITTLKNRIELGTIEIIEIKLKVFLKYGLYDKYKEPLLNINFLTFGYRYSFINKEYRKEFYEKSRIKLEKFTNEYDLKNDLKTLPNPKNKKLYEIFMTCKNYREFDLKYKEIY